MNTINSSIARITSEKHLVRYLTRHLNNLQEQRKTATGYEAEVLDRQIQMFEDGINTQLALQGASA